MLKVKTERERLKGQISHLSCSVKAASKLNVPVVAVLDVLEAKAVLLMRGRALKLVSKIS